MTAVDERVSESQNMVFVVWITLLIKLVLKVRLSTHKFVGRRTNSKMVTSIILWLK